METLIYIGIIIPVLILLGTYIWSCYEINKNPYKSVEPVPIWLVILNGLSLFILGFSCSSLMYI